MNVSIVKNNVNTWLLRRFSGKKQLIKCKKQMPQIWN